MRASIQRYLEGCKVGVIPSIRGRTASPLPIPSHCSTKGGQKCQPGDHTNAHAKTLSTEKTNGHKCPSAGGHMCPLLHDFPSCARFTGARNVHLCPQVFWPLRFFGWCKAENPMAKMTRICRRGMPPDSVWKYNSRSTPQHPTPQPVAPRPACHPVAQHTAS